MKMTVRKKWYKIENKILKKRNGKHENKMKEIKQPQKMV